TVSGCAGEVHILANVRDGSIPPRANQGKRPFGRAQLDPKSAAKTADAPLACTERTGTVP
ncbi:MAG: hypothetical protein R6V12_17260, partial [Candidatus Hydrogenedentota bacterium]